jgi:hypothetical protein
MKRFYFLSKIQSITIIMLSATCLSFNVTGASTFTTDGSGQGSLYYEKAIPITILNVNEAPALTTVSPLTGATEDTPFTVSYASLATAADESDLDGDPLSFRIEGVTTGELTKGGMAVVPGITRLSVGESLVWTPGPNVNSIINAFTIKAWDGSLTSNTAVQVQVDITAVNDYPYVNAGSDGTITEGSAFSRSGFFTDPDAEDTHEVRVINWGDGSSMQILTVNAAAKTFSYSHVYADNGVYTITTRITDNNGATATDQVVVTVTNVAPATNAGADGSVNEGFSFSQSGSFIDLGIIDTYTAQANYGDGTSVQPVTVNQAAKTFNLNHVYTENGVYTITVTVIDDDGGAGTDQVAVIVTNVAPSVNAGADGSVNEGSAFSQSGSISDPGTDTFTAQANYGDGSSVQTVTVNQVAKTFDLNHVYTDNGQYTITVTVIDDDGGAGTDQVAVVVTNVAPATNSGADGSVNEGSAFSQSGSISDPGADTYTAQANYGDGTSVQPVTVNQAAKTFNLNHVYTENGVYTITVTVIDDDGGAGTDQVAVIVLNVAPSDMTLSASSVNENVPANSIIGSLSTTDPGAGNTFTYALVTGTGDTDNSSFNINEGSLRITDSPDFETKSSYSVRVRTTDQGSLSYEKVFTISINDVIENVAPVVITQAVTDISATGATGNGNITDLGVPNPTQYGVVWSTLSNPTINLLTKTEQGAIAATGAFTSSITGLSVNSQYYVKAYATNSAGTSYGDEVTFTTLITDVVSLDLKTVKIYPNPADEEVNVLTGNITDNGLYTILSPSGIMLANGVIANGEARISLEKFSSGIYIIQIQVGIKKTSFRIIKK